MRSGLVHIYTGPGKGKTTAAIGMAIRAKSRGLRVLVAQFMKTGASGGELALLRNLSVRVIRFKGVLSPLFHPEAGGKDQEKKIFAAFSRLQKIMGDYDLMVLDEFNPLVGKGLIREEDALRFISGKPASLELVLTGRGAGPGMLRAAHYVTEMRMRKHPLKSGIKARRGIEY